jgi:hypothetical protein
MEFIFLHCVLIFLGIINGFAHAVDVKLMILFTVRHADVAKFSAGHALRFFPVIYRYVILVL